MAIGYKFLQTRNHIISPISAEEDDQLPHFVCLSAELAVVENIVDVNVSSGSSRS